MMPVAAVPVVSIVMAIMAPRMMTVVVPAVMAVVVPAVMAIVPADMAAIVPHLLDVGAAFDIRDLRRRESLGGRHAREGCNCRNK